jgi:hypothetical protein
MNQLRPGMTVLGADPNGNLVRDAVLGWLHYEPDATGPVLVISTASGKRLRLTRQHLVYRQRQDALAAKGGSMASIEDRSCNKGDRRAEAPTTVALEAVYAERVQVGDVLLDALSGKPDQVISIETVSDAAGLYAPLTRSGRLVVDGLLVSCYGTYPSHAVSHAVLWPARVDVLRRHWGGVFGAQGMLGIMPYAAHLYRLWTGMDQIARGIRAGMVAAAC